MRTWLVAGCLFFSSGALFAADILLEGKVSYFYPTNTTTRKIMGGGALFGIESSFKAYRVVYPWMSISILPNSGHSIGEHHSTSMTLIPIGLGLKYLFTSGICDYYLGAGMLPSYLHTKDKSPFVVRSRNKWGFGGIFKVGTIINFRPCFVDIFLDYTLLRFNFSNTDKTVGRKADLSGLSAGGAIGYRF